MVGDEDQSIYSWRGADIRNILDFEHDYPNARIIRLEQNYRSTKRILEAAGAVVANNLERKGKTLWTDSGAGEQIALYAGYDAENEALFIADTIERMLPQNPATAWPCCIAPISNRARSKKRCGATAGNIWWSAASATISGRK